MSGKDVGEAISERLAMIERRMLAIEVEVIGENIELSKRLWAMICKYEPELAAQLQMRDEP